MEQIDRRTYVGSSDAAAILGVSPWRTAYQVWQAKTAPEMEPDREPTPVQKRGKRLEPVVVEMLQDEMPDLDVFARNHRHWHPDHGFIGAEIDAEAMIGRSDEIVNVEIKTVHPARAYGWGEQGTDEIPLHYAAQVMHALAVTNRRLCVVAALIGADDLRVYRVERDDQMIDRIVAEEVRFWNENVLGLVPPPLRTLADANLAYTKDHGGSVIADRNVEAAVEHLRQLRDQARTLDVAIEEAEVAVKKAMGTAAVLVGQAGTRLATWKSQTRQVFDQKRFAEDNRELFESYRKTVESRVFRLA